VDISDTFGFTAPPEVVFNSLMDPERANRWLRLGVRAERVDRGLRLVTADASAVFDIDTDVDNLYVSWRSPDDQRLHARAHVDDGPAGGSQLHVLVSIPGGDRRGAGPLRPGRDDAPPATRCQRQLQRGVTESRSRTRRYAGSPWRDPHVEPRGLSETGSQAE
jgi:hypothetical protein